MPATRKMQNPLVESFLAIARVKLSRSIMAVIGAVFIWSAFAAAADDELWIFDRLDRIGGHATTVLGHPRIVGTPVGKAIEFDGVADALMVDAHPLRAWYHVAAVYDGREFRNYVNGVQEGAAEIHFDPQAAGRTSVGVRMNLVNYFKGAIRVARFTRRALAPREFLPVPKT